MICSWACLPSSTATTPTYSTWNSGLSTKWQDFCSIAPSPFANYVIMKFQCHLLSSHIFMSHNHAWVVQETTSQKGILLNNLQASFHSLALGIHVNKTTSNRGEKVQQPNFNDPVMWSWTDNPSKWLQVQCLWGCRNYGLIDIYPNSRARRILEECSTKCNSRNIVNELLAKP